MEIEFFDKYIDPTGKNILTPSALTEYLGPAAFTVTVPDFCPTEEFTIPINIPPLTYWSYARISYADITRYYRVTMADPSDITGDTMNYTFTLDWAHTLECGLPGRPLMGRSVVTRTNIKELDAYEQSISNLSSVEGLGNVPRNYGWNVVAIYATKRSGALFESASYQYIGVFTNRIYYNDGSKPPMDLAVEKVRDMMRAVKYQIYDAGSDSYSGDDVCSPVAFYVVPARFCYQPPSTEKPNIRLVDSDGNTISFVYQPIGWGTYSAEIHYLCDFTNYAYEIGTNTNRVRWVNIPKDIPIRIKIYTTWNLCGSPGEFSLTANINGNVIDLTEACSIPFVIANESEINVQVNRRNLALLSAGVQVAAGLAGSNPALLYGGAMSAASSVSEIASTAFPTIRGSGNLYSDSVVYNGSYTEDILKIFIYDLTSTAKYRNQYFGSIGTWKIDAIPTFDSYDFMYIEGDMYPNPRNYIESLNIGRMKEILDNGVRIYNDPNKYLS